MTVALPPTDDRKIADTWSAIGGELKPSLDVVVTAPMNIARSIEAGPPVLEEPRLGVVASPFGGAGGAGGAGEGAGAPGRRRRSAPEQGTPARSPAAEATAGSDGDDADETYTAGSEAAPGRRIRVRQIAAR